MKPSFKLLWFYICDNCDCAGVWKVDKKKAEFDIGMKINWNDVLSVFNDRIYRFDDKWYITGFVKFQYSNILNEGNSLHKGVVRALERHGIREKFLDNKNNVLNGSSMTHQSSINGAKDMDKDMDKEKDKEKEGIVKGGYGEFVKLTKDEYDRLGNELGTYREDMIVRLNEYIGQIGVMAASKKYKSHYYTILNWARRDGKIKRSTKEDRDADKYAGITTIIGESDITKKRV